MYARALSRLARVPGEGGWFCGCSDIDALRGMFEEIWRAVEGELLPPPGEMFREDRR